MAEIERAWHIGRDNSNPWRGAPGVFPRSPGPFIRASQASSDRQLVVGTRGLIPWFAKTPKLTYSTNNARCEELAAKASYKQPWLRCQRCIIPAVSFDEPCWETGKNVWWTFKRADGEPWGLAGLWNTWSDKETGEIHESYTMLTVNADSHPIMNRMHKTDPKLPPDAQDKRSVVAIESADVDRWLMGKTEEVMDLLKPLALEILEVGPAQSADGVISMSLPGMNR